MPRRARAAALAAVVLAAATVVVVATTGTAPAAAGPPPVVRGYVPLPTDDFQRYLEGVNTAADSTIAFTVGITNAAAGATIYYDHHEDGFEADIANPSQATTLVLGDGNATNGNAGTYCSACTGDLLPQGAPLIMRSTIPTPRNPANRFFDGGDKVASTRGITITAGGFSTPLSSVLSGVVSAYDTSKWGTDYTVPVGEDTPYPTATTTDAFSYTGASVMASAAGTVVEVDANGDGDVDEIQTVAEGRSLFLDGGLSEGATIHASAPVQVHLLTGRRLSDYEARSFTLYSDDVLSNDYMSPAGSGRPSFRTVNYLFNPGTEAITVTPQCTGCSGTLSVPAGASTAFHSPTGQAVRFSTTGARFIAVAGVGAQSGAAPGGGTNEAKVWDWGFTMLPTSQLTTQVALGWAPGNSNVPPSTTGSEEAYDPVWVTTLTDTTVHVDYDGNPTTGAVTSSDCFGARHDTDITVTALASTKIFDPDGDMTGARIYTCDGTKIAGAWGQDPSISSQGAPGFDAGYTIIPTSSMVVEKTARVATDVDGDGGFGPGDTMTYEIAIADAGSLAFTDVEATDVLPTGLTYVEGSTRLVAGATTTPYADDGPPAATPFPLDEGGVGLPDIAAGQTVYLRFEAEIVEPWVDDTATIGNTACVRAAEATSCDTSSTDLTTADVSLTKTEYALPDTVGDPVEYAIDVQNDGPDLAPGVEVTDLLPPGLAFEEASATQGTYDEATGVWSVGDLEAGGAIPRLTIRATVEVDTPITNTAEVTGGAFVDPDSTPGNGDPDEDDQGSATIDVEPVIDLEVEKEITAGPAADGTTSFTVSVHNRSVSEATGVTIEEVVQSAASTFVSATPSVGSFDPATETWTVETVAGGGTETLDITFRIDDFPAVNLAGVVTADQQDVDSTPGSIDDEDDSAQVDIVSDWIDLQVEKTARPPVDGWDVGDEITFDVLVENVGPGDATGVEVTDQLPVGLTFVDATPTQGSYDGTTGVWAVGDISPGSGASIEVTATITASAEITNLAQVTAADQDDLDSTPDATVDGEDDEAAVGIDVDGQGRIGDRVWDDRDGDGVQDTGEPGLAGVPVDLYRDQGGVETLWREVDTGADGLYAFEELDDGDYRVVVDPSLVPAGFVPTTPWSVVLELGIAEVRDDIDVGLSEAADLSVAKSVVSVGPSVGDEVTYRVTVANDGPAAATGIVVEDALPPGLADAVATASLGTYDADTGLWVVGSLADGASATLEITATVTASTAIRNTATIVEHDQPDPDPDDDTASADIDVDPEIDLSLAKEASGASHVGDEVNFTVTVANAGPSAATGVAVTDALPAGLADVAVDAEVGSWDEATGVWTVGDLAAGDDATLTVTATITDTSVTNTAEVTAAGEPDVDSTPGNGAPDEDDRASVTVEVDPLVDVAVAKTGTSPTAVGEVASFEVEVTNRGPSTATGIEVTDALPAGLTFVSGTPSVGTYSSGIWAVGSLGVDQVATLAITAILEEPGPVTNVATLTGLVEDDVDDTDDEASAAVSAPGASIGDRVWDDLDGDGTQDTGEPGLAGVDLTLLDDGDPVGTTTSDADGAYVFDGLAPGAYKVVADAATVPAGHVATTPTQVDVTLTPGQVVTTADIGFSGAADLVLAKTVTGPPTYVGDTATFRVTVSNRGPATATGVVVSDPQPAGLLLQGATASQGSFDDGTWTVGDLADGESATLDVAYRVDVSTEITNVAEITASDQDDPDPDDDTASATVDVDALIDLSVTKEEVGDPTYLGQRAVFEVTVANAGPSTASAVAVTDLLPAGLTFLSADPEVGTYDELTGLWAVGELAAGDAVTLEVRAQVDALSTTNTAEVSGAGEADVDSTPGNGLAEDDRATVDVTVLPRADLALTKTGAAPEFVGQNATFELEVANTGPSLATGVEVTDLLPAGLVFVSATATGGVYDAGTGVWTIGALPVDGSERLTITARLDVLGPVTNTAEVTAVDQTDPDSTPGNDAPDEDDRASASVDAAGGSIGDRVWDDRDADGTQDSGEPGLPGVTVSLVADGDTVGADVTDADGSYGFTDLAPGAYQVVVTGNDAPAGHVATTPTTIDVALAPGAAVEDADVGFSGAVDLRLDKTLTETPTSVGDSAEFEIVVTNDGPAAATGVVVSDPLPAALTFVSASSSAYDAATGLWTVGSLASGASATLTIDVVVEEPTAVNTAEVAAVDQDDPTSTPGNGDPDEDDTDAATIDVDALIDLSLTKEASGATHIGDEATFTLTVANAGPSPATDVVVEDLLPDGLTFVSASSGSFDETTGAWAVGTVGPDAEETLEIVATVDVLSVTNTAEVTAAAEADADSEPGNRDTDPGEDDGDAVTLEVAPLVDLSLAKTETAGPSHLGDVATFVLTVANAGPSTATDVVVADPLPAGLAFVSASATTGTYDAGTGLWSIPSIAADGSATLTLRAAVTDLAVTNRAEVVAVAEDDVDSQPAEGPLGPGDPPDQDDEDDALVTVDALVDVSVVKVETANPTVVGDEAVFEVTVANGGPATATDVVVTDHLPAGLTFVSADAEVGAYDAATGIWTVGTLAAGTDATLTVRAVVGALEVTNVAEVTATAEDDRDVDDDRSEVTVTVEPLVDLSLDKQLVSTPTHVGDSAVFVLTVANAGPSAASDVEVVDQLPAGLTYVSDDSGGAYDPESGEWQVGAVGALATRTLTITARVDALEVTNLAQVSDAAEADVDSAPGNLSDAPDEDDEAAAPVTVAPSADLSLTKTSSPTTVDQGDEATFTVTVRNDGPSPATGVVVTDALPDGVTLVSHTASAGSWSASTGEWAVGTIASGSSATLEVVVTVDAAGPVTNVAEVTAVTEDDPDSTPGDGVGDDVDSSTVSSDPLIDLAVTKDVSSPTAGVGEDVDFTVTVTNDGPSDATGVVVRDDLPTGLTHVGDSATQGSWSSGLWDVGSLAVGASATLTVTATVDGSDPVTNVAEVIAADQDDVDSTPDGGPPDEDDRAVATVGGVLVDVSLGIEASASTVAVGDTVTYTVTVGNDGPSVATGVDVLDVLPDGLTYVDATASVGSFDPASGTWSVGTLGVDELASLDLVARVDVAGSIANRAEIAAAVERDVDSTPGNLSGTPVEDDEDEVVISGEQIDLSLTKTVDVATPSVGGQATYTLTLANDGPSIATDVQVADGLPPGLRWVDDTSGGAYDPDTGVWTIASLDAGASVSITITTEVVASGPITNEARVLDAAQPDVDSTAGNDAPDEDDQDAVTIAPAGASVRGTIWLDADLDGVLDPDEPTIEGVTVLLVDSSGDLAGSALTGADGAYAFVSVAPGAYGIVVDERTLPDVVAGRTYDPDQVADGFTEIALDAGEALDGIDFGYSPAEADARPDEPPDSLGWTPTDLLARTGVDTWTPVFVGAGLLLGGAVVVGLVSRRRRTL